MMNGESYSSILSNVKNDYYFLIGVREFIQILNQ